MATQSSTTTLENCLPAMDYLLSLFKEAKARYSNDPFMASRVNSSVVNSIYTAYSAKFDVAIPYTIR
jgi:hypothetical protein